MSSIFEFYKGLKLIISSISTNKYLHKTSRGIWNFNGESPQADIFSINKQGKLYVVSQEEAKKDNIKPMEWQPRGGSTKGEDVMVDTIGPTGQCSLYYIAGGIKYYLHSEHSESRAVVSPLHQIHIVSKIESITPTIQIPETPGVEKLCIMSSKDFPSGEKTFKYSIKKKYICTTINSEVLTKTSSKQLCLDVSPTISIANIINISGVGFKKNINTESKQEVSESITLSNEEECTFEYTFKTNEPVGIYCNIRLWKIEFTYSVKFKEDDRVILEEGKTEDEKKEEKTEDKKIIVEHTYEQTYYTFQ